MLVKFLQSIRLKNSDSERFIKAGSVVDLPEKVVEILVNKNKAVQLHPEIDKKCVQPFPCEWIDGEGICALLRAGLKRHCLGPYRVTREGIFSYKML